MSEGPCILSRHEKARGRHLVLEEITWRNSRGENHLYESAGRAERRGSVAIIARLNSSGRYILVRQFRPTQGSWLLEFPAGLLDEGESAGEAALRELKEETGYTGRLARVLCPRPNSPGLSSEGTALAFVVVDEQADDNRNPQPQLEPGEEIEVLLLAPHEARRTVLEAREDGTALLCDTKVSCYFLGLGGSEGLFS